jgi:formamidopyrimidine-DNA glycosylase
VPELPEVETTLRGIRPYLAGRRIERLIVREPRLRLPIPPELPDLVRGREVMGLARRGKYLLIALEHGTLLLHLGMSGSLRVLPALTPPGRHDHWDLEVAGGRCLRLRDPRRFGLLLWTPDPPTLAESRHPLLKDLGPEPLGDTFRGAHLHGASRGRRIAVKPFLMDSGVVVGVGNIYASESLFLARIAPTRPANRIAPERYERLAQAVRTVLGAAIAQGGTTLRDFVQEDGNPGYFTQHLQVYGRAGLPCPACAEPLRQRRLAQRATYYCPRCQH